MKKLPSLNTLISPFPPNYLEESLSDEAQVWAPYTPSFGGSRAGHTRGGYNSDDITRVGVGGGGVEPGGSDDGMTITICSFSLYRYVCSQSWMNLQLHKALCTVVFCVREGTLV